MNVFFLLVLSLFSLSSLAGPVIALGVNVAMEHESDEALLGRPLLQMKSGYGFLLGTEIFSGPLTLNLAAGGSNHDAKSQYSYLGTTLQNVSTEATNFFITAGPRWRFIYTKFFRAYLGGGLNLGSLRLEHDVGAGLENSEKQSYQGYYAEIGTEFILNAWNAFKFTLTRSTYETGEFSTLNNQKINVSLFQIGAFYMLNLDFK